MALRRDRAPFLALGAFALLAGLWGALARLGWALPGSSTAAALHGPLMALGFLGTVIGLERAVALGTRWPFAVPLLSGGGAIVLVAGGPLALGGTAITAAGAVLVAVYASGMRRGPETYAIVMAAGAVAWAAAALLWTSGWSVSSVVPLLALFLVLTIAGERLELARLSRPGRLGRAAFVVAVVVFALGVALSLALPDAGVRLAGAGLVLLSLWLARFDIARQTVRRAEPARYIAICLLAGYAWLAVTGLLWLGAGAQVGGTLYDAMLHSLFLGFVLSMVFGHEIVIVPAVLGVTLRFGRRFYVPLVLLHLSLIARVIGDLTGGFALWQMSSLTNVIAILLFIAVSVSAARGSRTVPSPVIRHYD